MHDDGHLARQCGFSNTVVQILNTSQVPYETVNILEVRGPMQSGFHISMVDDELP